ncbi:MAG: hypothetical protein D6741_04025 [Planctomycetota bacterium]|nr:MAG: hypothetical protein D6741_04025 [Planctomycetota bacterium]
MSQGTIKKLVFDRGFGFISTGGGPRDNDVFFHFSAVQGARFEDLAEGQSVTYELSDEGDSRRGRGPRASTVTPV